jgi:SAM-dependent methyltransferase
LFGSFYVATGQKEIDIFLKEANLKKGEYMLELGSGNGRVLRTAAKVYGVHGKGVDINPILNIWARLLTRWQRLKGLKFTTENVLATDMSKADVIYIFLMPKLIKKLEKKLLKEPKKGALIISHGFEIHGLKKFLVKTLERKPFPTYFYRI